MGDGPAGRTAADLVAEASQRVANLSVDDVAAELDAGDPLMSSPCHLQEFDSSRPVIPQRAAGGRSALAADTLQQMGYTDVAHADGGFSAWKQTGRPAVGGPGS